MGIDGKWDKGLARTPFQDYLERQYLIYYSYLIVKCIYIDQSASYLRGNHSYNVAMTMSHLICSHRRMSETTAEAEAAVS